MTVTTQAALPPQMIALKEELQQAGERLRRLCQGLDEATWARRPASGGWSIAECVTHLNITSERYIPLLDDAMREARAKGLEGQGPFPRGFVGWALLRHLEPPYRIVRTKTTAPFQPVRVSTMAETLEHFDYLQQELQARIDRSAGLALDRIRIASPFNENVKYNLYVAFAVLPTHQRRHLWQAERTRASL